MTAIGACIGFPWESLDAQPATSKLTDENRPPLAGIFPPLLLWCFGSIPPQVSGSALPLSGRVDGVSGVF